MKRTTVMKNLEYDDFVDKVRSYNDGMYFNDGNISITIKKSKYYYNSYDFIGNDGIWTNNVHEDELYDELYEYYIQLLDLKEKEV